MFKDLNPLLHSQLRLAIISYLISNNLISIIERVTKATSGNISVQLKKLEKKYITITKGF